MDAFDVVYTEEVYAIAPKTVVLIDRPWSELPEEERLLLEKILNAVRLSINAVSIRFLDPKSGTSDLPAARFISFGAPEGVPHYELTSWCDTPTVHAESLDQLSKNDQSKKLLWQALKKLFSS